MFQNFFLRMRSGGRHFFIALLCFHTVFTVFPYSRALQTDADCLPKVLQNRPVSLCPAMPRHGHGARLAPFATHTGHGHKTGLMAPPLGTIPPAYAAITGHRYRPRPRLDNPQLYGHHGANHAPATFDRARLRPACPVQVLNVQKEKP